MSSTGNKKLRHLREQNIARRQSRSGKELTAVDGPLAVKPACGQAVQ
jgi:ribosomal protein L32